MKKKLFYGAFLALCFALCITMSLGFLLRGPSKAGANESRAGKPTVLTAEGKPNLRFLSEASEYFETRFFLRQELISCRNKLVTTVFAVSPDDAVIAGRRGWLYYGSTLADYTDAAPMDARTVFAAANNLALMQEYCASQNAQFLFTAAPNKNSLYGEHMPGYAVRGATSNVDRLYARLAEKDVAYLDLHQRISAEDEVLYFAHDSHWNSKGAALAADAINAAFGRESQYYLDHFAAQTPHSGDLYEMLYPAFSDNECDPVYGKLFTYSYDGPSRADSITLKTEGPGQGRLLCYRDSFGNLLHPFLADSFGEAVFSRSTAYDLTRAGSGDCVLIELVERNLGYLTEYVPKMPAPERDVTPDSQAPETVLLTAESAGAPEGHVCWTGRLDTVPDGRSGVYLLSGDAAFECFLLSDSRFAAALPEGIVPDAVAAEIGGVLTAFPAK